MGQHCVFGSRLLEMVAVLLLMFLDGVFCVEGRYRHWRWREYSSWFTLVAWRPILFKLFQHVIWCCSIAHKLSGRQRCLITALWHRYVTQINSLRLHLIIVIDLERRLGWRRLIRHGPRWRWSGLIVRQKVIDFVFLKWEYPALDLQRIEVDLVAPGRRCLNAWQLSTLLCFIHFCF